MSSNCTQAVRNESFHYCKTLCLEYCVEFRHLEKRDQAAFLHVYKKKKKKM